MNLRPATLFLLLILGLVLSPTFAATEAFYRGDPGVRDLPAEYGEVIYQINPDSPKQLYIIGISHRDTLTRTNGPNTAKVQAEIYKTGEWLIENGNVEVLLPEGFFKKNTGKKSLMVKAAQAKITPPVLDLKSLEEQLSDDGVHLNAEMLLRSNFSIDLQQVEDKNLYDEVGEGIVKLVNCRDYRTYLILKTELDYLQSLRTAAMVQRIPEAIEDEVQAGNIKDRKALFTIGLNHINEVVKYLQQGKIAIPGTLFDANAPAPHPAELNLLKEGFGVTIILPRTLIDDQKALEATGLATLVNSSRSPSSPPAVALSR